ncbi:hypothetical protein [Stenotrophomonas maltophilia]|uniref:hypothetical protein n=1 Tax=Stenotrophomonas maltophilia TaxID=40324 RepID=UPI0039C47E0C
MQSSISFPIIESFSVNDYGLYPGKPHRPGLQLKFRPGLTLVVGTNGLGKTTMATLLFRMLSGPHDLSLLTLNATELGGQSLDQIALQPRQKSMFADRVNDRASNAHATLELLLGGRHLKIKRAIKNLSLVEFWLDGELLTTKEPVYQETVFKLAGLSSFGDWLMFLRQLVFYFEDRRSLVWDASAQRQVFRMLFLPPSQARDLYTKERNVLKLDSDVRNNHAALGRLQLRVESDESKRSKSQDVLTQVRSLQPIQQRDLEKQALLVQEVNNIDEFRRALRRQLLEAEDMASRLQEQLEDGRLKIIHQQFPSKSETAKYLLSLLMLDGKCAVCSESSPAFAQTIEDRAEHSMCVLCGSPATLTAVDEATVPTLESLAHTRDALARSRMRVAELQNELKSTSENYDERSSYMLKLSDEISARESLLKSLIRSLPADDELQLQSKQELIGLRSKVEEDRVRLQKLSKEFESATQSFDRTVSEKVELIKKAFNRYAKDFLFEDVSLKWAPLVRQVGQLNSIETSTFDLDMGGTDFGGTHRREGPSAVSESQREFIDLAFRMALIEIAGGGKGGTLVIDAPESSLDAVFVQRAAEVLCRFGNPTGANRLLITSNLIDGRLLPDLIRLGVPPLEKEERLLNLMEVAVPTAAVKAVGDKYQAEWESILHQGFGQ